MPLCGPKLSLCGVVISAWGILQLSLMGVFFYIHSVALIEDIPLEEEYTDLSELRKEMESGYNQNALNCWIAALLYLVTLCFSVQQFWMNNRSTYRMTRHGLNCTNSAVYSYAERKKDQKAAGYGAERMRLGKDAVKGFDCCSLTLQPTTRPVITPQGWIFDKEAIFKFILDKKKEYEKKMAEYDRQKDSEMEEFRDIAAAEKEQLKQKFEETEKSIVTKRMDAKKTNDGAEISNMTEDRKRVLPAFWLPSCGPQAKKSKVEKPDKTVYCPMSRKPIRVKDLVDVQWTVARDPDDKRSLIAREERYQCAVTGDVLNNSSHCVVLRPTGHVVTVDCVEKIIKKDWQHPLTGQSLKEKDIIYIQRGATGFSSANSELIAERDRPAMSVA